MAALHITSDNYESEVLNSDKPVLLDFWASWMWTMPDAPAGYRRTLK